MAESNAALIRRLRRESEQSKREKRRRKKEIRQRRRRFEQDQRRTEEVKRRLRPEIQVLSSSGDDGGAAAKGSTDRIKEYMVIADPYDGTAEEFDREFQVVTGLANFRLLWDERQKKLRDGF